MDVSETEGFTEVFISSMVTYSYIAMEQVINYLAGINKKLVYM